MPLKITSESYNGLNSLYANAGDWVLGEITFSTRFAFESTTTNKAKYISQGSIHYIEINQGDFGSDFGFLQGETLSIVFDKFTNPPGIVTQLQTKTITYISGNTLYLDSALTETIPGGTQNVPTNTEFPTDGEYGVLLLVVDKASEATDFEFNLTPNSSTLLNSVIDSEVNRFELQGTSSLILGVPAPMTQIGNQSGGFLQNVQITYLQNPGDGWRDYRITYLFNQWGFLQDGNEPPNYYDQNNCLAPVNRVTAYSQYANPNGVIVDTSQNTEANTGFYDENYNGGVNNYEVQSTQWFDSLGNPISGLDYSGQCTFESVLTAPNQVDPDSTYRIGLIWRPEDTQYYQNLPDSIASNLMLNAPIVDFIPDGIVDTTVYSGFIRPDGAEWSLTDLKFEITALNELTITGKVIPNGFCQPLFIDVPDGGRKTTLWLSIGNFNLTGQFSDRVSLRLFDDDNIDAPTIGVQIPNVIDQVLLDHDGNDITDATTPNTTTEDDVLYISNFRLPEGIQYEGVRARIYAYNQITEEEFTLEDNFFSFATVPFISGKHEIYQTNNRTFNLPPTSDRNKIALNRFPANDIAGQYALKLEYGYLSDWRYWEEQANVNNDFFDPNQSFNGKNKNWQRFYSGDWIIRLSYYTRLNGVDDFNHQDIGIRPYEDENCTTTSQITVLSDGSTPSNYVNDELHEQVTTITWNTGTYVQATFWAEVTIEDFQAGNRWVLSSILDQGGISSNPLKPISGQSKLDVSFLSGNQVQLSFLVDTSVISSNEVSPTYRIHSDDETGVYPITENKDAQVAYSVRKVASNSVYPDSSPCIRVRRSFDSAESDIGFTGFPLALDQTTLLNFVTNNGANPTADGYVTIVYDQSGNDNHATQTAIFEQQTIVAGGVIELEGGKPMFNANPSATLKAPLNISEGVTFQTAFTVAKVNTVNTINYIFGGASARGAFQHGNLAQTTGFGVYDGSNYFSLTGADFNRHLGFINLSSGNALLAIDGGATTNLGSSNTATTDIIYLGGKKIGSNLYLRGNWQEVILFNNDKLSEKTAIESNINTYFSIY